MCVCICVYGGVGVCLMDGARRGGGGSDGGGGRCVCICVYDGEGDVCLYL